MTLRARWLAVPLALGLAAATPAHAGSYTLDDVVHAAAIGLSEETLLRMAESPAAPWAIDGDTAVRLLRSGVAPTVVAALSGGEHPTPREVALAAEPGPGWSPSAGTGGEGAGGAASSPAGSSAAPGEAGGSGGAAAVAGAAADASGAAGTSGPAEATGAATAGAPEPADATDDAAFEERIHGDRDPRLSSVHAGARAQAGQAVAAGTGTALAGIAVLAGTSIAGEGDNPGLSVAGAGLAGVGGTSILTGSLLAARALRADGYRVSSAPGWVGVGMFGTGLVVYGGTWLAEGDFEPSTAGAVLTTGGVVMGLVQAAVNHGQRLRQLRNAQADRADALPFPDELALPYAGEPALPAAAGR